MVKEDGKRCEELLEAVGFNSEAELEVAEETGFLSGSGLTFLLGGDGHVKEIVGTFLRNEREFEPVLDIGCLDVASGTKTDLGD